MDRRSWLWRRKPSEKRTGGETESSGSPSSHSARFSDDQEVLKVSPNHTQSPEISSKSASDEVNETVKALTEKLSGALLKISAKEDLVNQHAKVAEEAVLGWEKAEKEVSALKQQLHAAAQKNSNLEDRIGHLDDALKECLRHLRRLRQDQEQKIHDGLIQQSQKWESERQELERKAVDLRAQLESKAGTSISFDHELFLKLDSLGKENSALKVELMSYREDLQIRTVEKELLTKAAEAASKQHLESVKKAAKIEAECRRLRASARKSMLTNEFRPVPSSVCMESIADSLSDCGSDSWASALISELDQFKSEKRSTRSITPSVEIDLMDDFLEMERLAALPEASLGSSAHELEADSECTVRRSCLSQHELEDVNGQMVELEEKVAKLETGKGELEKALEKARYLLLASSEKSDELQRRLNVLNGEKHALEVEAEAMEAKRGELELQLDAARMEIGDLKKRVGLLEEKVEDEKCYSEKLKARCKKMDALEAKKNETELLLESALSDARMLRDKSSFLEKKVEENTALLEKKEAKKKEVEFELGLAHKEIMMLKEKVSSLERKVDEERALSIEFESKYQEMEDLVARNEELSNMYRTSAEAKEARAKELEDQLYLANLEVEMLRKKASSLEENVEEERKLSAVNAVEIEASKEKELGHAADKLAKCQKTIASLHQQLKTLASFDDFLLEAEKMELTIENTLVV
ncbi:Filament-like plant protein 3 [Ananas comosus]|uniref:Filament-like plant protein 3 n=1 Tax=Ananas comosus TaxID=4615 RepID=A0A199W1T2_ANACO|nr:Filament-like plant protein 3 [Ananas comosus]